MNLLSSFWVSLLSIPAASILLSVVSGEYENTGLKYLRITASVCTLVAMVMTAAIMSSTYHQVKIFD